MITSFDYNRILLGLQLGLKAAGNSCESPYEDKREIAYAIRLLELARTETQGGKNAQHAH